MGDTLHYAWGQSSIFAALSSIFARFDCFMATRRHFAAFTRAYFSRLSLPKFLGRIKALLARIHIYARQFTAD